MHIIPQVDPEFLSLIPPLSEEERNQLEQNILFKRKCRDAIILWGDIIIDGYNRYEICVEHGIQFEIIQMDFPSRSEAKIWILDNQLGRRNLTEAMRIELALSMTELLRERARKKQSDGGKLKGKLMAKVSEQSDDHFLVRNAIATDADTSEGTLRRYIEVKESGNQALLSQVQEGKLKIGTAHRMLGKEIQKQLARADRMYSYIFDTLPTITDSKAKEEILSRLSNLQPQLSALIEKYDEGAKHEH
ncbi:MAG: hypothetical protein FWE11_08145 [Defluviitaleaceae bacterium]|nr:hypothetical protein [Defluviitaleaceae bacterium]